MVRPIDGLEGTRVLQVVLVDHLFADLQNPGKSAYYVVTLVLRTTTPG
jgi:hypothetical protein